MIKWIDFLLEHSQKNPKKVAVVDQRTKQSFSYSELLEIVNLTSLKLKKLGVKSGDVFCFLANNRFEHIVYCLAASRIKAIFVPLNFRLTFKELESILIDLDPCLLITSTEFNEISFAKKISIDNFNSQNVETYENQECFFEDSILSDPILMLFTSGSTGKPKGVLFHGEMLLTNMQETAKAWELNNSDKTLIETPFFHTGGYNVLCFPLLYIGGTVFIAESFLVENVLRTIKQDKITVYFAVPTMFQMISEHSEFPAVDLSSLRFLISGGASCPESLIQCYQSKGLMFKQGFGLTEVGPNCFLLNESDAFLKIGSIGKPMPHSNVLVLDIHNNEVQENETGELLIAGKHLTLGYYKNHEEFQKNLYFKDGLSYFRTGDLVQFDHDGFFYVVGRLKDMYISGGENVYPGEVEKVIVHYPNILDAVVVPIKDQKWGEVGLAYLKTNDEISFKDLKEFLNQRLSRYKHPHKIQCMKEFPILANGKVDRKSLKELSYSLNIE